MSDTGVKNTYLLVPSGGCADNEPNHVSRSHQPSVWASLLSKKRIWVAGGVTAAAFAGLWLGLSLPASRGSSTNASQNFTNPTYNSTIPRFIKASIMSPDMTCGGSQGYTCVQSAPCCSLYGWCGSSNDYCGSGTQSNFAFSSTGVVSTPSTPSAPVRLTPDQSCSGSQGYTCGQANPCCSQYGWCGSSDAYCGSGTQAAFAFGGNPSPATPSNPSTPPPSTAQPPPSSSANVDPNGTCGGPQKFTCTSTFPCCSQYGWCGNTDAHCGAGSQPSFAFSTASSSPSPSSSPSSQPIVANGLTYYPSDKPMADSSQACGPSTGNQCGSSACCSRIGYCGTSSFYCSLGCQGGFGACNTIKPPTHSPIDTSRSVPTFTRCTKPGLIALTFDDGEYIYTAELLNLLRARGVKASFFINGANRADMTVAPYPDTLRTAKGDGHFIGSHTYNHLDLTTLSDQDLFEQMYQNDLVIKNILGVSPTYVRVPFGNSNARVLAGLATWGYKANVLWNVDTQDFVNQNTGNVVDLGKDAYVNALQNANPATDSFIFLQHDPVESTVKQLIPWVIDTYVPSLNKGWKFVTLDECLGITDQYK